jgi:hypothetical protein
MQTVSVEVIISSHTVIGEVRISSIRTLVRRYAMSSGKQLPTLRMVAVPPSSGSSKDFVFTSRYGAISCKTGTFNTDVIVLCTFWCLYSSREIVLFQEFRYTKYKTHFSPVGGFGDLEVACWPLVPNFAGSHPAETVGFLRRKKSSTRLPSEGK